MTGRHAKADRLSAIAEAYYQAAPDDDEPPEAAAVAMPAPRPRVNTNAVSHTRATKPPVDGPSSMFPSPCALRRYSKRRIEDGSFGPGIAVEAEDRTVARESTEVPVPIEVALS